MRSFVRTADGTPNEVLGYLELSITFNSITDVLKFCVVPSLKEEVYLGIDFWNKFKIIPFALDEITIPNEENNRHSLSDIQEKEVAEVIESFPSYERKGLGRTNIIEHTIDVGNSIPIKQRFYPISPAVRSEMYRELDRMIELDVIEESNSSWSSPVVMVRKSNGKSRLCLDSRKVNGLTKKDAYPLPLIDGLLGRLSETKYISSLDLKDAFWQIPLAVESRDKTAFTVPGRPLYQFKVMPFGLCNAPQTMCRLMDKVIPHRLHDKIFVYLDDLLIISSSYEEHISLIRLVAKLLSEAGLTINIDKSHFLLKEIKYLGFLVGEKGLRVDPEKVEAIVEFPVPATVKQIRRFLGMSGWYRRFIPNFSGITAPITDLLKNKKKFHWTPEAQSAFIQLKTLLTTSPVLKTPNYSRPFYIRCDASTQGIGSVLYQLSEENDELPISYMSQKLNGAQKNYSITELECLAAVLSVKKFRPYVEGHEFTIITDHASLKWLMTQRDLSGRLARWSLKLQAYNFKIEHQKASQNVVPDALSRIYCDSIDEFEEEINKFESVSMVDLNSSAFEDVEYKEFREKIVANPSQYPMLRVNENKIFIKQDPRRSEPLSLVSCWKLWVPKDLTSNLIAHEHTNPLSAHCGIKKTMQRLRRVYYWPRMIFEVTKFISDCETCKSCKAPNTTLRPPLGTAFISERPFQRIYVDLLGPYPRSKSGKTTIIIVVDQLTKFVVLKTINKAVASKIVEFLKNDIFLVYGVPEIIHSDNGVQFVGKEFQALLKEFGVKHMRTAIYSPQSNASERVNRSILAAIRAYLQGNHKEWDILLPEISCALRSANHDSTGHSPYYAVFGYNKIDHGDAYKLLRKINSVGESDLEILSTSDRLRLVHDQIRSNLSKAFKKNEHTYNLRSREIVFEPGQKVFVRTHPISDASKNFSAKLAPKFIKAFILSRQGNVNYIVGDENGNVMGTYHAKDIKT